MKKVEDFFNPYDIEHLREYHHLEKYGYWDKRFLAKYNLQSDYLTALNILRKLSEVYVDLALNGKIIGMPN